MGRQPQLAVQRLDRARGIKPDGVVEIVPVCIRANRRLPAPGCRWQGPAGPRCHGRGRRHECHPPPAGTACTRSPRTRSRVACRRNRPRWIGLPSRSTSSGSPSPARTKSGAAWPMAGPGLARPPGTSVFTGVRCRPTSAKGSRRDERQRSPIRATRPSAATARLRAMRALGRPRGPSDGSLVLGPCIALNSTHRRPPAGFRTRRRRGDAPSRTASARLAHARRPWMPCSRGGGLPCVR